MHRRTLQYQTRCWNQNAKNLDVLFNNMETKHFWKLRFMYEHRMDTLHTTWSASIRPMTQFCQYFRMVRCKLQVGASESLELLTFRRLYPRPIGRGTFTSRSPDWLRLVLVVGIIERQASFGLWVQSKRLTAGRGTSHE